MKTAPKLSTLKKKPVQKLADGSWVNGQWVPTGTQPGGPGTNSNFNNYGGLASQAADVGAGALGAASLNTMSNNIPNSHGVVDVKKSRNAGIQGGAATGLKIGSTIGTFAGGPLGTAIGGAAGAGIGALVGGIGAKRKAEANNKTAEADFQASEAERIAAEQKAKKEAFFNANFSNNMSRELTNRYAGYADGGLIKGAGTGKSDDIKAIVKKDSFVVPAENKKIAEEVRVKILKAPSTKKANLNQNGGEPVKLSNGEHLFTPEEAEKIESELGEEFLEALAPNADESENKSKGGRLSAEKARIMLHDGVIRGKPITEQQRKYFGYVANKKDGGKIEGYADGGKTKPKSKNLLDAANHMNYKPPYSTKGSNVKIEPQAKSDRLGKAPSAKTVNKSKTEPSYKTSDGPFSQSTLRNIENDTSLPPTEESPLLASKTGLVSTLQSPSLTNDSLSSTTPAPSATNDLATTLSSGLGAVKDYGLPALQTYMGLKQLQGLGKRPVDKIDPDYLAGIATSRGVVDRANGIADRASADARYGYSPEELASLNMQNNNATSAGRFAARNYSGGSAGNAFNMERTALNDSFDRGLAAKIGDRNLRFQKQQYADNRRGYADSKNSELNNLLQDKADRSRMLFGDTMNSFMQNQSAGQELVGAGLRNLVSAGRYRDELEANKQRDLKYNI